MKGLLAVERMVLESVAKGREEIKTISEDTGLTAMFVRTILSNLVDYNVLLYRKGFYRLSKKTDSLRELNKSKNIKFEVKDLFGSLVDNYFSETTEQPTLKMQKIWLTEYEYKVLKSMMSNMDSFIKSVRKDRLLHPEQEVIAEQRVVFWGSDTYSKLINTTLKVA